jgi:vacuolar-type H+-ATPase subunit E/Vma4
MDANQDPAGTLQEEIFAEARQEAGEIVDRAHRDAEALLAAAALEANKVREDHLDRARAEGRRRRELILATVPVEAGRLRVARVESLLESVRIEARERLLARGGFEYREAAITLAVLAISRMSGAAFVVKVSQGDRALLGDGLAEEVARGVGRARLNVTVTYDPDTAGGGVVVEDEEARQVWDNRFPERLERMWPELRRRIAVQASLVPKTESGGDRL